jgi:hypothetical protein
VDCCLKCCFFTKHTVLQGENKDWVARNQIDMSETCLAVTCGLLFEVLLLH